MPGWSHEYTFEKGSVAPMIDLLNFSMEGHGVPCPSPNYPLRSNANLIFWKGVTSTISIGTSSDR
jgi:hypothetical protein